MREGGRSAGRTANAARGLRLLAATLSALPLTMAHAQPPRGARAPDAIRLLVRPRVGDTLRLQVEQTVEMESYRGESAAPGLGAASERPRREARPDYGPRANRGTMRVTRVELFAHSVVEASDLTRTSLRANTDSIAMWSGGTAEDAVMTPMAVPPSAGGVRVQVTTNGAMRVIDPPGGALELGATLASVPGLLPDGPVSVGSSWTREMPLPLLPLGGYRADGVVQARLRLDSLTHGGRDAWVSLEGVLRRDGAARELPTGTRVITAGTIRGSMLIDRTRAWIVDARTVMEVQSEVVSGPAGSVPAMLLDIRISQRMRVR